MKSRPGISTAFVAALGGIAIGVAADQMFSAPAALARPAAAQPEDYEAVAELWADAGTPDEHHKVLARLAGEWDADALWYVSPDPEEEPIDSPGEQSAKMILGGRYLSLHYTADMMGDIYEGYGLVAYDKVMRKYVSTWADSTSTMIFVQTGDYDAETKTLTMEGTFNDPSGKETHLKHVFDLSRDNAYTMKFFDAEVGKPWRHMGTIEYSR